MRGIQNYINGKKEFVTWTGKKQIDRPQKRMPSGDATKSLSESTVGAQIRQY